MRLKSFDNYLIASMCLLALYSLYMLYGVKLTSPNSGEQIKVASIVEQIRTVKRKHDFYQSWVDVNHGDDLKENDEIYTHDQSSAKINFENGAQINLFENSLLKIKSQNKKNTLTLEKGNLTATLSKDAPKLDVILSGKKYSFESENANIQIEQGVTENKFLLLKGKASLNINEAKQDIKENQIVIQNKKTGAVKVKEIPFVLKTPLHNSVNYFVDETTMSFNWSTSSPSTPVKIMIAKNATFTDLIHESTVTDDHYAQLFKRPGTYYWKLISNEDVEGPIRTFTLIEERPLPINLDKEIIYKGPKKVEPVRVSWPSDNAKNFLLKVKFPNEKIDEIKLSQNNYELTPEQIGLYNISVKIQEKDRPLALWSDPSSLQVIEAKAITIESSTPELIEKINYNAKPSTHLISWKGPDSGVTYTVKLTKNNKSENYKTENTSQLLSLKESGEYLWEVKGETESGVISNIISGKIIIKTPLKIAQSPSEGAVIELERPDQLVSFKWDQVEDTKEYQFELASDSEFKNLIYEKNITGNNLSTAVAKTGRYFWRVKIKKGEAFEYSPPVSVEIKPTPPLSRPEDLPRLKIKLKYLDNKTSFLNWFISNAEAASAEAFAEWDIPGNSRAKEYIVEIYQDEKLSKLVTRIESSTPHIIWKNAAPGTFYWRVSYVDFWGRKTEFSKASTLATEQEEVVKEAVKIVPVEAPTPAPIELKTPKHREEILEKIEDEYLFSWEALPHTTAFEFMIDHDLDFKTPLLHSKTNTNSIKIKCADLKNTEGEYYWKVITTTGNTSKRRMFRVTCTLPPKIEEPVANIKPEEKKLQHYAIVGLFPHQLSYTNTSPQYSAKVSGNAIESIYGSYHRPVDWHYFQSTASSLYLERGKVFNTITFSDFELNFKVIKNQSNFSWGPVISVIKKTLYIESNLAIAAEGLTSPLLGIFIHKDLDRFSLNGEVKLGGMLNYHADIQYALKQKISVGAFFDATTVTKDEGKHSFESLGLNLNYIFPFLDIEK